ncbi:PEP-CTERM sorting domain-containing protein [Paucibacter sp. PLA-PC-4]|uniref:beta strand repeat-containing protein n=1 Tax=Paucibacter sp. PLA-PC-4 TaxID=2993655 RepID=UPI00224B1F1C|nr:PEP-CTERM sorting domain-containing protein [Paucibacter sp. PLA-PC-4]MCX2864920.1 PEP-CTERM sorting domain-containing protein [Paucibacter sp. PLA-PC-4]
MKSTNRSQTGSERKRRDARAALRLGSIALALMALQTPATALDYLWKGANGNWEDANQWTLLGVPGPGDTAALTGGSTALSSVRSVGRLVLNGGQLYGGMLTAESLDFFSGNMGGSSSIYPAGQTTVTGSTVFDGARSQAVNLNHTLTLQGNSTWTAGEGGIVGAVFSGAIISNATFMDLGTASSAANAYKTLGGAAGTFINNASYVRNGLGTTRAYGFDNAGTMHIQGGTFEFRERGSSAGLINVAAGAELAYRFGNSTLSGQVDNQGWMIVERAKVDVASSAVLNGNVQIFDGTLDNASTNTLNRLVMSGGQLTGTGHLTVASLDFRKGDLGGIAGSYQTGQTTVTGNTVFDGASSQGVSLNHTLTLQGNSTWTAGEGGIAGSVFIGSIINNATFMDLGTASSAANAYKTLGGSAGSFINNTSYVRTGLGTTRAYGFDNAGTLHIQGGTFEFRERGASAGLINVAAGAELAYRFGNSTLSGQVDNQGWMTVERAKVDVASSAVLNGNVQIFDGTLDNASTNTLNRLVMSGGQLTGTGHLTVASLDFRKGDLGGIAGSYQTGQTTVTGNTVFDGASSQGVSLNHTLTLQGNSTWTPGEGGIAGSVFNGAVINNAQFTDLGTASSAANAYKTLRGYVGTFVNNGSYVRTGLGTTRAYGFENHGLLSIKSGTFGTYDSFSNTGTVEISEAAVLQSDFENAGLITGVGTVDAGRNNYALVNRGTLDPGLGNVLGTLTIDGDLVFRDSAVLRIDLASAGASDMLVVTDDASWNGELSVWASAGTTLQLGDVYTIATFNQRLSNSTFDSISWHGLAADQFAVEYNADSITLRVTAVPEPATYALWALGLALVGVRKLRARRGLDRIC